MDFFVSALLSDNILHTLHHIPIGTKVLFFIITSCLEPVMIHLIPPHMVPSGLSIFICNNYFPLCCGRSYLGNMLWSINASHFNIKVALCCYDFYHNFSTTDPNMAWVISAMVRGGGWALDLWLCGLHGQHMKGLSQWQMDIQNWPLDPLLNP